ncbi:MAG: high-affinity iron transporter [Thermoleophilaceae bacterium]|nr:high-affinity iron transporter [Thermoleophilaceae bacterium]
MHLSRRIRLALVVVLLALAAVPVTAAGRPAPEPWSAAEQVRTDLFDAGQAILLGDGDAAAPARAAQADYAGGLAKPLGRIAPQADRAARSALADSVTAAQRGDGTALALARGAVRAAIYQGSYKATIDALADDDADQASGWLLIREFRTATKFTRPGADGTSAVKALAAGQTTSEKAELAVEKDLLDAYQARTREILEDAGDAEDSGFAARRAERASTAAGYWQILADRYREERGAAAARDAEASFDRLVATAGRGGKPFVAARDVAEKILVSFTAAPFTAEEEARRAQQLLRFVNLVPVEYARGVAGGRVTKAFEVQEAIGFRDGAESAFVDLLSQLQKMDPARTATVRAALTTLETQVEDAAAGRAVADPKLVQATATKAADTLTAMYPASWKRSSNESDLDLVQLTLDRMMASVGAADYDAAEQARLEAYAFFEFGPELYLRSIDPGLAQEVEGLIWFGYQEHPGLANLIAQKASAQEVRDTNVALGEALTRARNTLGQGTSDVAAVTNAAIIVFREGLEAVLILAALMAGISVTHRNAKKPIMIGVAFAFLASVITWVLAQTVIQQFAQYGEKLEAIVGIIAIGVLLLILNWFFHKVYWTQHISTLNKRKRRLLGMATGGFVSAQVLGLIVLGLSTVYREGFEVVLFLQALVLSSGAVVVLEGLALGLAITALVAVATFRLQKRLPYKKMLIYTGVMVGVVLLIMVGKTVRAMQGVGWVPITPLDVDLPFWAGLWFGIFPTLEVVVAQALAAVFVVGSYYAAERMRKGGAGPSIATPAPAPVVVNGNGSSNGNGNGHHAPEPELAPVGRAPDPGD